MNLPPLPTPYYPQWSHSNEFEAFTADQVRQAQREAVAAAVPKRSTGWTAPKDRYAVPVLFSPYTGEPRDVRDVQSDPQGILIQPPGQCQHDRSSAGGEAMIALVPPKIPAWQSVKVLVWKACLPFLENTRAVLIHRPRSVQTINIHSEPHIAVQNWCGTGFAGRKKLTFLSAPPEGKLLCQRCERNAVRAGQPSADALAGRHVHQGKLVAVQTCCDITGDKK